MIKFLSYHAYTMKWFLEDWGKELRDRIVLQKYKSFITTKHEALHSAYIFSDLERINARGIGTLSNIWKELEAYPVYLLNNPAKVLTRLPLLNRLHEEGINDFNAYPIVPGRELRPERFPVFIREANTHDGPSTELIHSQDELDQCIQEMTEAGELGDNPIVTEYVSVKENDGQYLKYAAFRIGERIIPAHIHAGDHWMIKFGSPELDENMMQRETGYIESNPHEKGLRDIFRLANIDYGRIDYGVSNGRIQVFEINTNPTILLQGNPRQPTRRQRKQYVAHQLIAAFRQLDTPQ